MAMAVDLLDASKKTASQLAIAWNADTLDTKLPLFATAASLQFEDATPNDRPVGNWLVLIQGLASQLPAINIPQDQFNEAIDLVARMCLAGYWARQQSRISVGKAAALLAAWNAQFGT